MRNKKYYININEPCSQDWHSMEKIDTNNFCAKCSKEVLDLTNYSDSKIIELLENDSSKICGRLKTSQIDRIYSESNINNKSKYSTIAASLLFLGITGGLSESYSNTDFAKTSFIHKSKDFHLNRISDLDIGDGDSTNTIQGSVTDSETKEAVPFANVIIKDSKVGTTTDIDGNFKLEIPKELFNKEVTLVFSYVGYEQYEISFKKQDFPISNVSIQMESGNFVLGGICSHKVKKWWQFWKKH